MVNVMSIQRKILIAFLRFSSMALSDGPEEILKLNNWKGVEITCML